MAVKAKNRVYRQHSDVKGKSYDKKAPTSLTCDTVL